MRECVICGKAFDTNKTIYLIVCSEECFKIWDNKQMEIKKERSSNEKKEPWYLSYYGLTFICCVIIGIITLLAF